MAVHLQGVCEAEGEGGGGGRAGGGGEGEREGEVAAKSYCADRKLLK